jgi:hypothetical protein
MLMAGAAILVLLLRPGTGAADDVQPSASPSGSAWVTTLQASGSSGVVQQGPGSAIASVTDTITLSGPSLSYTGTIGAAGAVAAAKSSNQGGAITGGTGAAAGAGVTVTEQGYAQNFYKGGNSISKSESVLYVTIIGPDGKPHTVAEEVALAYARSTQFGGTAGAFAGGNVAAGYTASQVLSSKPGR